jgi:cyclic pyranopterin phosphate synthase
MKENREQTSAPSHWGEDGRLRMVDVSGKEPTLREARASGKILVREETLELVRTGKTPKGDIFTVSQIAGIQAAKQTPALIPMCHPLPITHCRVDFRLEEDGISAETTVRTESRTGVEMEALVGTAAALLTLYDMLKPVDKTMVITSIELKAKSGGKSGDWKK